MNLVNVTYEITRPSPIEKRAETMSSSNPADLESDEIFEILSSQRRRMVLYHLRKHGSSATVNQLAQQIAAWENDVPIDELTNQQRKRVYVSLYQTHLPKLADTSFIEYDVDEGDVRLTDRATAIDAFLSPKASADYSWRRYYLGLLVLGGGVIALAVLMVPVLGERMLALIATVVLAGYLVMVGVEYWYYQNWRSEIPSELEPENQ